MKDLLPMEQLIGVFDNFKCTRDKDIQDFMQNKALLYENRGWCSTYVLINEKKLENEKMLVVDGYFTLSNKVIQISNAVSNSKKRKLFKGLIKKDEFIHFILIGQLGKYIDEEGSNFAYGDTCGKEMLDNAFEIIYQVKERITCNCVLIECKDNSKIQKIYEEYGFVKLQKDAEFVQYIMFI